LPEDRAEAVEAVEALLLAGADTLDDPGQPAAGGRLRRTMKVIPGPGVSIRAYPPPTVKET
jgi:hypothetical protein